MSIAGGSLKREEKSETIARGKDGVMKVQERKRRMKKKKKGREENHKKAQRIQEDGVVEEVQRAKI